MEGKVKFFNRVKGFGFITGDDQKDYFVHYSGLKPGTFIRDGDLVSFDAGQGDRGLKAENVTLVKKASEMGSEGNSDAQDENSEDAPANEKKQEAETQDE